MDLSNALTWVYDHDGVERPNEGATANILAFEFALAKPATEAKIRSLLQEFAPRLKSHDGRAISPIIESFLELYRVEALTFCRAFGGYVRVRTKDVADMRKALIHAATAIEDGEGRLLEQMPSLEGRFKMIGATEPRLLELPAPAARFQLTRESLAPIKTFLNLAIEHLESVSPMLCDPLCGQRSEVYGAVFFTSIASRVIEDRIVVKLKNLGVPNYIGVISEIMGRLLGVFPGDKDDDPIGKDIHRRRKRREAKTT